MEVISTVRQAAAFERARSAAGPLACSLVPTMGALHAGHAALIRHGVDRALDRGLSGGCIVTIFVNPTQFNDPADYQRYPRTLEADLDICREAGAAVVLAPPVESVYLPGRAELSPALPAQATEPGLEDSARPGHFAGVCQVVSRLFELTRPTIAVFGEKDWQQLCVIEAMARRDWPVVEVVGFPIVREPDGLAMSSRNVFLGEDERTAARSLSRALLAGGLAPRPSDAEAVMRRIMAAAGVEVDYAVVREARTLLPDGREIGPSRSLVAGRLGSVRLLDNAPWPGGAERGALAG